MATKWECKAVFKAAFPPNAESGSFLSKHTVPSYSWHFFSYKTWRGEKKHSIQAYNVTVFITLMPECRIRRRRNSLVGAWLTKQWSILAFILSTNGVKEGCRPVLCSGSFQLLCRHWQAHADMDRMWVQILKQQLQVAPKCGTYPHGLCFQESFHWEPPMSCHRMESTDSAAAHGLCSDNHCLGCWLCFFISKQIEFFSL